MQFLVLGPLAIIADGHTVALPAAKHRALLTALLVHANQTVSADGLIDALWNGEPPASAAKTLQTYVSQLRRELEPSALPGDWRALRTVDGGYRLRVSDDRLDASRFERLTYEGRQALSRGDAATAAAWLREGLALWRGRAYGELAAAPFARAEAARLEEMRLAALEVRAEAELALGGHAELVGELEELVGREPFRERIWGHLMLALYRSGRQADALSAYRKVRDHLADQLGIDPGTELRRLEERILRQDPDLDLATAALRSCDDPSLLPPVFATPARVPLVGRDAELGRLRGVWEEAMRSGGRLAVLSGEPGIGKSRLAAELARLVLRDGGRVLVGHADEEPIAPYQPFVEALGQHDGLAGAIGRLPEATRARLALLFPAVVPGMAGRGSVGEELDRFHLLSAVTAVVAAISRNRPLLLVLEDLHWADRASLAMLLHLVRSPERSALLVLVTARDSTPGADSPWAESIAELRRHRLAELISVPALADDDISRFVSGFLGHRPPGRLAAIIARAADGNPFFIEELLSHLVDAGAIDTASHLPAAASTDDLGIPEGVRHVIKRRMASLSPSTAELLQVAAILGREFEFTVLSRMTGWEEEQVVEAVEEALRVGMLSERGSSWVASYSFRHALVREALYGGLSLRRRQGLHLRAAAAIQVTGPLDAGGIMATALHLRMAGPLADQLELAERSQQACDAAAAVYAWDEAAAHLHAAFEAQERLDTSLRDRARLAERLGVLVHRAGTSLQDGIGHLEWALAAYESLGDLEAAARTHSRLGMHLTTFPATLDVAAGLAHYQAAEAQLGHKQNRQLAYLYVGMAMAAVFGVRTGQLEIASARALELAEDLSDEPLAGWSSYQRAWWAFNQGHLAESMALHERMRDLAARLGDSGMGAWAAFGRALLSGIYLTDPHTAQAWCARALALPHLEAFPRQRDSLLDQLGHAKGSSGELAEARRVAASLEAGTVLERMLCYWSGDWEESEAAWAAAGERDARSGDHLDATINAYWLGRVRRLLGAHEAAEAALSTGLSVALQGPQLPAEVMLRAELALLAAVRGQPAAGQAEVMRCQEIVGIGEDWRGLAGRVSLAQAMLAASEGRAAQARGAFAAAVTAFRKHGCFWDEAEARALWAMAQPAEADRHREAACDLYQRAAAGKRWIAWATGRAD